MPETTSSDILEAMKRTHWQQAKGHLFAMLETFHSGHGSTDFEMMEGRVKRFVAEVEDHL